ncbi:MAG: urea ABC transporter permease subunit UrtB [Desulfobacula sp.]|jgi:urea transport system permease protein
MDYQSFLFKLKMVFVILMIVSVIGLDTLKASEFEEGILQLTQNGFTEKNEGLTRIVSSRDKRTGNILHALLDNKLFYLTQDKTVVFAEETDDQYIAVDVVTGKKLEPLSKENFKKIGINNQIREKLKGWISELELSSDDPDIRMTAVYSMLDKTDPEMMEGFKNRLLIEPDKNVRKALNVALSVGSLKSGSQKEKLDALLQLEGELHPAVRDAILETVKNEAEPELKNKAINTLQGIEFRVEIFEWFETLFFGLSAGSILVLAAIGLAITFGVIGVINMAHGELIMIGAYTTYVIQQILPESIGISIFLAIPAAFLVSGLTGILIERSIIRFLYGRPLETLLATFGLSLVLQQAVRSIFSPLNRAVKMPDWMSGSLYINPVLSLTMNRIFVLIFCLLVFFVLYLTIKKTTLGLQVRAISQNRPMARAMGVKAGRVDALTFGLGSGIAGVAGVALSQLTNVGPNLGQAYIIDSFMVVVFGGVGNLWGALLAGLSLGTANKFIEPFSGAVLAKIIILVFIIIFIQKKPQGLFPQKGRAAG